MNDKPILLDAYCGAGGCTRGYQRAGFYVVGVDVAPQPNYCGDEFVQTDALEYLEYVAGGTRHELPPWRWEFAAIHASPPCQAHVRGFAALNEQLGRGKREDLIGPTRKLLERWGGPYVIENVEGAPLVAPVRLCGSSLGLPLRRHRLFESNLALLVPPCNHSWQTEKRYWSSFRGEGRPQYESTVVQVYGNGGGAEHWAGAMDIDWMDKRELAQAVPPAYTELIGLHLMQHLNTKAAA